MLLGCDAGGGSGDAAAAADVAVARDGAHRVDLSLVADLGAMDTGVSDGAAMDGAPPQRCELPAPFDLDVEYARDLWVRPGAEAAGADGSEQRPFSRLLDATAVATPGTRIRLEAGVHRGSNFIVDLRGTREAPIAIVGAPGAVLDAEGASEVMHLLEPHFVVLEDLELRGSLHNGLNIDDGGSFDTPAHDVVLRRLYVHDVGIGGNNDCVKLSGLDHFFVLDSEITDCREGSAIDMVGCHEGLIAGNALHDVVGNSVIQAKGGTADVLVHGNRFTDTEGRAVNAGGSTGLQFFRPPDAPHEAARIEVAANVMLRVGADSGAPIAYVGCDACVFRHNTVVEPRTWVARILQETTGPRFVPARDGRFVGNVVVYRPGDLRRTVNVGPDTAPETFEFARNLWHALDDPGRPVPEHGGGVPPERDSRTGDPRFVGDSFRLGPESAAAGIAGPEAPGWPDHDGRCYGSPSQAGAFAFVD